MQNDLQQVQKKISKEKQRYSTLLEKYEQLQNSNLTAQLVVDTSQQEDHDKSEELQTARPFDEDTMTELTKLQLVMEDVSVSLEKVNTVKKYWEQVCICKHIILIKVKDTHANFVDFVKSKEESLV